jgi:hypothetical protein
MSNIEPYSSTSPAPVSIGPRSRLARQTGRALAEIDARTGMVLARIEAAAELQAAKAHAVAYVGRAAMQDVALLSQVEQQLAQAVPHASGRLAAIADLTAIALTEVVVDTAHRVGR